MTRIASRHPREDFPPHPDDPSCARSARIVSNFGAVAQGGVREFRAPVAHARSTPREPLRVVLRWATSCSEAVRHRFHLDRGGQHLVSACGSYYMRRRNAQRFEGKVAKQRRRRAPAPAKSRKSTEEKEDQAQPKPNLNPHRIRGRLYNFSPTPWRSGKVEKWKSSREARRPHLGFEECWSIDKVNATGKGLNATRIS